MTMPKLKSGIAYLLILATTSFVACGGAADEEANQSASTGSQNKAFIHTATSENLVGASTLLDSSAHPELTDPNTKLIVTQRVQFDGLSSSPHNDNVVAVTYNQTEGRWAIINTIGAVISEGTQFNVLIPGSNANAYVHNFESADSSERIFKHESATDPNAKFFITPVFDEFATPISTLATTLSYSTFIEVGDRWSLRREGVAGFSVGERFNVYIAKESDTVETFSSAGDVSSLQLYQDTDTNYNGLQFIAVNNTGIPGSLNRNYCVSDLTNIVATSVSVIRNLDEVSDINFFESFNVLTVF